MKNIQSTSLLAWLIMFYLVFSNTVKAQNEAYSQFYNSRLQLNPALTGHIINDWRLQDLYSYREYTNNSYLSANSIALEAKFPIVKQSYFYGVIDEDYTNLVIGIGVTDDRHSLRSDSMKYASDYLSLAIHKKIFKKAQLSIGAQAGMISYLGKSILDFNLGGLFASRRIDCEYAHQIFGYELGASYYHTSQSFKGNGDTLLLPSANIQLHGQLFFKMARKVNMEPMLHYQYNSLHYFNIGTYFVARKKHPTYDGFRVGVFYRNTQHLVASMGMRIFGKADETLAADITLSYDMNLRAQYRNGVEISLALYPLRKCWKVTECIPK